jgi:hypothetical protein
MAVSDLFNIRKQVLHRFQSTFLVQCPPTAGFLWSVSLQPHQRPHPYPLRPPDHVVRTMSAAPGLDEISYTYNRSAQVLSYDWPRPTFLPQVQYRFNDYLKFEVTYGTLQMLLWLAYYFVLEPFAAVRLTQRYRRNRS